MIYINKNIPLGELDMIADDNIFSGPFKTIFTFPEFSREIRSTTYIEIPYYNIKIYECNHEKYNFSKRDYIFKYRYYFVTNNTDTSYIYTDDDLSFILCVYNYLNYTKNTSDLNILEDVQCNIIIE